LLSSGEQANHEHEIQSTKAKPAKSIGLIRMGKPGFSAFNLTREKILADSLDVADTFVKSLLGLIGKSPLTEGQGLWIKPCQSIHTFWMRFPIDVMFLDKDGKVVHLIDCMKPFRVSKHVTKARSVLELPAHTIGHSRTQLGDCIEISKE
jgi:uncharacterized protein